MSTADHPLTRRLVAARELAGLSQLELGDSIGEGYGRTTISKHERGMQRVTPYTLRKWADACGVSLDFFFVDFATVQAALPPIPQDDVFAALDAIERRIKAAR